MQELEFVRGNQKSYVKLSCEEEIEQDYEYQMYIHNTLHSLLTVQVRNQNGVGTLYYEVGGMQPLDVFLQTQKLKRPFMTAMAGGIIKLSRELSEYALNIEKVVFWPKYIMLQPGQEEVQFLYGFGRVKNCREGLEQLLECFVESLDYGDDLLMEQLFGIYEQFLEQKEQFSLEHSMEALLHKLTEEQMPKIEVAEETSPEETASPVQTDGERREQSAAVSAVAQKEAGRMRKGVWILFFLNLAAAVFWQPFTLLKLFLFTIVGIVLLVLGISLYVKQKGADREGCLKDNKASQEALLEEYELLSNQAERQQEGTQIISVKDMPGVLYNLQGCEPKYIYIEESQKLIGKDAEKVQILLEKEGISRIHALLVRTENDCIVEDLNSTNGTRINGRELKPRERYVLRSGDKVCFADLEYIFR